MALTAPHRKGSADRQGSRDRQVHGVPASRRLLHLYAGLTLFGVSVALLVAAGLGVPSWDVLHQGISRSTGLPFGWVVNGVGALVLLAWIPLRERPGIGTISNVVVVGLAADAALSLLPEPDSLAVRVPLLLVGIALNAVATGLYVGAGLGPGPRDGLMTGLARRGVSIRAARTAIEAVVLAVGWLLGGTVGVGTVLFAVAIGPLAQLSIRRFALTP
ncbi:membrane protein YczE [Streptomyces sp. NPDC055287]